MEKEETVLVTGGLGFIGSNFIRHYLAASTESRIINIDKITYAGNPNNLNDIKGDPRYVFVKGDICDKSLVEKWMKGCDAVLNFAAETHVDRSIIDAGSFVQTDVLGTYRLLEAARKYGVSKYVQISTDEVYGSIVKGSFTEESNLSPSSPYSASKAGGDLLALAYWKTYGMHVSVTRSSNNYGPYQHPEKLIPRFITNAIQDKPLPLYGDGRNVRDWLHVLDNCRAIKAVKDYGKPGETYNAGGGNERINLEITRIILKELGKPESLIKYVDDRPGHDRRYSIDSAKIRSLGWKPSVGFETGMKETVRWYALNEKWWKPLLSSVPGPPAR
ncbi:MAG: dTDP-glucose 4,6-dehydratase [Candidatus Aenigmarchaeota archaeon]|nr:dTDP-glucose 4,6-dehydratase [Candidatus Aenigmarchaeota archaeon]